jgi:isopenicillin-N epimerase
MKSSFAAVERNPDGPTFSSPTMRGEYATITRVTPSTPAPSRALSSADSPPIPDIGNIRDAFTLDPDVAFLNHGSFGACPVPVLARQAEIRAQLERQPMRFFFDHLEPLLDAARRELAAFVHADLEGLAFVTNATQGVNTVLRSLMAEGTLKEGDELLTTDHEYNACKNALDFVATRTGARVVVAKVPFPIDGPDAVLEAVLASVTSRTRLALLDHVTSPTALVFPIARIVRELQARGVAALVDGAHAVGMLPLDLEAIGAAFYTSNCHKWLCAPKGCALLHVRADWRDRVRPLAISHGYNAERRGRTRFHLEFDWPGTQDPSAYLSLPAALAFMGSVMPGGIAALQERNHALAVWGRARVCEALGVEPAAPTSMLGSMATIPLPRGAYEPNPSIFAPDPLQAELLARFHIEIPVFPWPRGGRCVRLSAQAYNRAEEYMRLGEALAALLPR